MKFPEAYPNQDIVDYEMFSQYVRQLVACVCNTSSVCKGKFIEIKYVLPDEVLHDVHDRLEASSTKFLGKFSAQLDYLNNHNKFDLAFKSRVQVAGQKLLFFDKLRRQLFFFLNSFVLWFMTNI